MSTQVKLTEQELKQIIAEAVHNTINEDNFLKNWWDKLRNFRRSKARYYNAEDDGYIQPNDTDNDDNGHPFYYGGKPGSSSHVDFSSDSEDGERFIYNEPQGYHQPSEDSQDQSHQQQSQEEPQNLTFRQQSQEDPQDLTHQQQSQEDPQDQSHQQQPTYKRGSKYHVNYTQENEKMFNDHIVPSYNSLNAVMNALNGLKSIGQENYNQASSIFTIWGNSNQGGGQAAFKNVCQQIDSIMPTLNNLKKEMKAVLSANGVKDSEDYKHYNMQEQKIRNIISSAIENVLNESRKR